MILVIFAPFVYNITLSKTGKERKEQEITDKLAAIDYHYDEERNQFV